MGENKRAPKAATRFQNQFVCDPAFEAELKQHFSREKELIMKSAISASQFASPHFIVIGAQKAGTTWLYQNLRKHPQISLRQKEYHYFDKDRLYYMPHSVYASYFKSKADLLTGDITPAYAIIKEERIEFMHCVAPAARLVFLVRNPANRAWSAAMMHFFKRKEGAAENVPTNQLIKFLKHDEVLNKGFYSRTIAAYLKFYAPESLLVCDYDRIRTEPEQLLLEVLNHIGADSSLPLRKANPKAVVHAAAGSMPMPPEVKELLAIQYADEVKRMQQLYPAIASKW